MCTAKYEAETFHMIDRCDPEIASWSETGENFVVKNVDKFANTVLPLYFKHSNFSSFARQLNFYGFRKLRSDPILTSDVDPRTVSYVRFYHEKFQKDKPELLTHIKRATKTDQQSKDEVESLRSDIYSLKETLASTIREYDRKISEISYECNRRINTVNSEYDKLATIVHHLMATTVSAQANAVSNAMVAAAAVASSTQPTTATASATNSLPTATSGSATNHLTLSGLVPPPTLSSYDPTNSSNLLQSLSHAVSLQNAQHNSLSAASTIQQLAAAAVVANAHRNSIHQQQQQQQQQQQASFYDTTAGTIAPPLHFPPPLSSLARPRQSSGGSVNSLPPPLSSLALPRQSSSGSATSGTRRRQSSGGTKNNKRPSEDSTSSHAEPASSRFRASDV
jgi:hypothetical protein